MRDKIPETTSKIPVFSFPNVDKRETLSEEYVKSIFFALDKNKDGSLSGDELSGYDFGVDNLDITQLSEKLNAAESIKSGDKFEKKYSLEFRQNTMGVIELKHPGQKEFVQHTHPSNGRIWAHGSKISGIDFTKDPSILDKLKFTDTTFQKNNIFPSEYSWEKVFEQGLNPGLNVDKMQEIATGKGVSVIVIDNPLTSHKSINDNIVSRYDTPMSKYSTEMHQHGTSVTSVLTQIAPDVEVHSFGSPGGQLIKTEESRIFEKALELIESLPENQRPKIISLSAHIYNENSQVTIDKIQKMGCWVLSCDEFSKHFGYLDKIDATKNPNDFENYRISSDYSADKLYVNSGDRTLASSLDDTSYRHDSQSCLSWAVPVVSGLYAAAAELKPDITPEEFIKIAKATAYKKEITDENEKEENVKSIIISNAYKKYCLKLYPGLTEDEILSDSTKKSKVESEVDKYFASKDFQDDIKKENNKPQIINIIDAKALMEAIKTL